MRNYYKIYTSMASTPTDKRYRGAHDPYNGMEEAEIRPNNIARQELSAAEQAATKQSSDHTSDSQKTFASDRITRSLRNSEENQQSTFTNQFRNSVQGKNSGQGRKKFAKKIAPLTVIIGVLFGGGAFFYGAQSLLAPHLSALYTNATDLQYTSYHMRNSRLMSYLLNGGGQVKISGFTTKYSYFSPYLKSRLAKNGIEVGHLNSSGVFESGQIGGKTVLKFEDKIIDAGSFQNEFVNNANFRDSYYQAKRGRIAGFFDDSADYYYKNKGATRDIFDQYKSTGDNEVDTKNFETTVSNRVTGSDASVNTMRHETDEETGEDHIHENGDDIESTRVSGDTPESKARAMVNSIAGKVSTIGVPVCSALRIANIAAITVASYQIYQSIAYFLSLMEPISKMMAGEGDASAINETLNFMTTSTTSEVNYVDSDGTQQTKTVTGSLLESSGSKLVMGNTLSPQSEVEPYSFDNITKAATMIAVSTGVTNTACAGVMAASAIVSLASSAIPGGKLATFIVGAVAQTIGGIVMTVAVAAIINAIIPYVAKIFASNIFETYTGIPAGELFSQGAATANFNLATQGSAYMPSDKSAVKTQNRNTTLALAQEAELDRLHHSPFDATNPNTFLGSLLSNFTYLSYSNNTVSHFSSFINTVGSSVRKITSVSAADEELTYISNNRDCTFLEGATCDMYGLPIPTSDYSTIDVTPDDPAYIAAITPNLDENGEIKENSELAKFINFCDNRQSPWGVKDANILNALQTDLGVVGNNLPFVNELVDVVNAAEDVANEGWATGSICMNSEDNPRWENEFKYYQLYVQDMRILSGMAGDDDQASINPVIAYLEKYDATHPQDNSFEGTLARISGQTKDDIAMMLEFVNYSTKIADYDPSTRYSFSPNPEPTQISITDDSPKDYFISIKNQPIFIDKRNYLV